MDKQKLHDSIISNTKMTFSRSGGAGGQNVNKVNTKVHASLPITYINGLSEAEIHLLKKNLSNYINTAHEICIDVQDERFQEKNRSIAYIRLESKIVHGAQLKKKRHKTHVPQRAKEKRLQHKKLHSEIKSLRKKLKF